MEVETLLELGGPHRPLEEDVFAETCLSSLVLIQLHQVDACA